MSEMVPSRAISRLITWGTRLIRLMGVAGVARYERPRARIWANRLEIPLLLVALWIPFHWYLVSTGKMDQQAGLMIDQLIWGLFAFEQIILLSLVQDRRFYIKTNWLLIGVVSIGLPMLLFNQAEWLLALRLLRGMLVVIAVMRGGRRYFRELGEHVFFAISLMTGFVLVLGGSLMPAVEPQTFHSFHEAVWWTLVTISTVGYGDFVPQTDLGRQVAMGLVIIGVAWMSLISATIAAFLVGLRIEMSTQAEQRFEHEVIDRLERIERQLAKQAHADPAAAQQRPKPSRPETPPDD